MMPGTLRGTDLGLVRAAQSGDQQASTALVRKYRSLIRCKARSYFLVGADREDVIQEGMIGLYKAIRDYDPSRQASFRSFAELCVTRQMITAVKTATRRKHVPLNTYVSLSRPAAGSEDDGERVLSDILAAREVCDPAEIVISAWEGDFILKGFSEALSDFEARVLGCTWTATPTRRSLIVWAGTQSPSTMLCNVSSVRSRHRSIVAGPAETGLFSARY